MMRRLLTAYASDKLACPGCWGEHACIECKLYVPGSDKKLEEQQKQFILTGVRRPTRIKA
jgi:hypothetical protein